MQLPRSSPPIQHEINQSRVERGHIPHRGIHFSPTCTDPPPSVRFTPPWSRLLWDLFESRVCLTGTRSLRTQKRPLSLCRNFIHLGSGAAWHKNCGWVTTRSQQRVLSVWVQMKFIVEINQFWQVEGFSCTSCRMDGWVVGVEVVWIWYNIVLWQRKELIKGESHVPGPQFRSSIRSQVQGRYLRIAMVLTDVLWSTTNVIG